MWEPGLHTRIGGEARDPGAVARLPERGVAELAGSVPMRETIRRALDDRSQHPALAEHVGRVRDGPVWLSEAPAAFAQETAVAHSSDAERYDSPPLANTACARP